MFSWLRALATKRFAQQTSDRVQFDWNDVYDKYAAALQKSGSVPVRDISELPYPKEAIKAVLLAKLKRETDAQGREALRTGYLLLADFQEMTDKERLSIYAAANVGLPESTVDGLQRQAQLIIDSSALLHAVLARSEQERARLRDELRRLQ